jgi:plasmid stabilization system protein ParE
MAKELLFRYMLAVAKRVKSSMLVANAWHARFGAASSLVVGIGILGNLAGYPILDPIAALIVGFMVTRMGWGFGWDALHDLMDRSVVVTSRRWPRLTSSKLATTLPRTIRLARLPEAYTKRDEFVPGPRMCPHGRLIFRVVHGIVRIVRVLHSARDIGHDDFESAGRS